MTANNTGSRQAAADADAAPAAGSGMVLVITYTNDKSTADLQRALKSNDLTVRAVSNVKTRSRAKAGAKGTATVKETGSDGEDGEADQRISGILDGAASIASAAGGAIPWGLGRTRAKAKTAEGSMGAAAAYAQNVEKNYANAAVSGRYTIVASGDFVVEAIGENGADISADASSVKDGTGTAAAVNVVAYDFAALLDSGKATATSVTVHAGIPDADAAVYRVTAVSGAGDGQTGLVGSGLGCTGYGHQGGRLAHRGDGRYGGCLRRRKACPDVRRGNAGEYRRGSILCPQRCKDGYEGNGRRRPCRGRPQGIYPRGQ